MERSMTDTALEKALRQISRGEISRVEAARQLDIDLPFGDMLGLLRARGLPLPRFPVDRESPGVRLITALASRNRNVT
jgi:hypothetical protein